jgi:hypothetical protein
MSLESNMKLESILEKLNGYSSDIEPNEILEKLTIWIANRSRGNNLGSIG